MLTASLPAPTSAGPFLHPNDLVRDRELAGTDEDKFDHARIAEQLLQLVETAEAPSNIALYGPWGSGKSGIANLLRVRVESKEYKNKGYKFARFDAFKYADVPLRRTFVSAVASELKIKDSKFHDDLYTGSTSTDVKVPAADLWKIVMWFAIFVAATVTVLVGAVAVVAIFKSGPYRHDFDTGLKAVIVAGLIPASLLSALLSVATKSFHVNRSLTRPDSDEQFEKLLKDLVEKSGASKVVIFVDELDRCRAAEVVETLDAVRTFLGVPKCVFVVAADQQVLEQALSKRAEQSTPADKTNPYYSTGSAYLDKVFQYQVSLPDLLPPNVTEFAAELVRDKPGSLWDGFKVGAVVSVLVPSHVVSPRRVKHLLNAFALTYRLAEDRFNTGKLELNPADNAQAVAKLVCLRVEFPLFARDLTVDPQLPEHVLALERDGTATLENVSEEVEEIAKRYASGARSSATLLVDDDSYDEGDVQAVEKRQSEQLHAYLRRTQKVDGPSRDLIFMQSEESLTELNAPVARELIEDASNGDTESVIEMFDSKISEAQHGAALRYLNLKMRHALGVEGENIARTLLVLALQKPQMPFAEVADEVVTHVASEAAESSNILDRGTVEGAWNLCQLATYHAKTLRQAVLDVLRATPDIPADFVLRTPTVTSGFPGFLTSFLSHELMGARYDNAVTSLQMMDRGERVVLFESGISAATQLDTAARDHAEYIARKLVADKADEQAAAEIAAGTDPSADVGDDEAAPEPELEPFDPAPVLESLGDLATAWANESDVAGATAVVNFLLKVDAMSARGAVEMVLPTIPPTEDNTLATVLATSLQRRVLRLWPGWLSAIGSAAAISATASEALSRKLIVEAMESDDTDLIEQVCLAVAEVCENAQGARPDVSAEVVKAIRTNVTTAAEAAEFNDSFDKAAMFAEHSFVTREQVEARILPGVVETIRSELAEPEPAVAAYVRDRGASAFASGVAINGVSDECLDALDALDEEGWLSELERTDLQVRFISAAADSAEFETLSRRMPGYAAIDALVVAHGKDALPTVDRWLDHITLDLVETKQILVSLRRFGLSLATAAKVRAASSALTDDERIELLRQFVGAPGGSIPISSILTAIRFDDAPEALVGILIARYEGSSNNRYRSAVLRLWSVAEISDDALRARLFDSVATPMAKLTGHNGKANAEAIKSLLDKLVAIGAPPEAARQAFDTAMEAALASNAELQKAAVREMPKVGYKVRKGLIGKGQVAFRS